LDLRKALIVQNAGSEMAVVQNETGSLLSPIRQLIELPIISNQPPLA
jgi:hypothetical protein